MTFVEAIRAIRDGNLDDPLPVVDGDPEATAAVHDLALHLRQVVGEVRRILDEIAVQGRLGGQASVGRTAGVWSALVVDVNYLSARVTDQIRDLTQTVIARQRSERRAATAPASGEIRQLMEAVNAYAGQSPNAGLANDLGRMAERIQANMDTLAERADERTDEVRRLLDARTQFFAALSHEFRTPLAVILRQAEALLAAPAGDAEATAYSAGLIRESGEELLTAVNDVLELARAENDQLDLDVETFDLVDLIAEVESLVAGLADSAEIDLRIVVKASSLAMTGDRRRIRQMLLNLIDNAIKYTPDGGKVRVRVEPGTSVVRIAVVDTGVGIGPDERRRIFEPFYRVPGVETQRGEPSSGLGLAITKRIVAAHSGVIYCMSNERGSQFEVLLPLDAPAP
jgi:signal transduction histidine kinase